jgi:CHAD domain
VAPLAATIAASVALAVGVALARAQRDRRAARAQRSLDRRLSLLPGERLAGGLRRMALGQLDLAIELLTGDGELPPADGTLPPADGTLPPADGELLPGDDELLPGDCGALPGEKAVHETRKALKRIRTLLRLLEDELGEQASTHEDAVLRDAGRRLAAARDAEVMVSTLDDLLARHPGKLAHRRGVLKLRARLVADRDAAAERTLGDRATRAQVLGELRGVRGRVAERRLPDRDGIQAVEPALKRLYRRGRRAHRRAARGRGDRARAMHEWRKRVKDLRHAAEALDRSGAHDRGYAGRGRLSGPRRNQAAAVSKPAPGQRDPAYIHRLAGRADQLGELLGEEHDLVLLAKRVRADAERGGGSDRTPRRTRKILLRLIARRRKRLRRRVLRAGKRLYRRSPNKFVRRVRAAHARASRGIL